MDQVNYQIGGGKKRQTGTESDTDFTCRQNKETFPWKGSNRLKMAIFAFYNYNFLPLTQSQISSKLRITILTTQSQSLKLWNTLLLSKFLIVCPTNFYFKMKSALLRRKEISFEEPVQIVPSDTSHEHLQRVEEWTQKSTSAPPSNRKHSAKEQENHDLEAKSQLIAEAVELLDSRDKQTQRVRTPTANDNFNTKQNIVSEYDNDSDEHDKGKESHEHGMGKHFRESNLSARNYIRHFEGKMNQKKAYEDAILNTYPSIKSKKDLRKKKSIRSAPQTEESTAAPVVEPDSWRFKASRSVKFSIKSGSGSQHKVFKETEEPSEQDDKWVAKQDNDPDWWRWKLKQRFLQNDELLHKLASQRQKLEVNAKCYIIITVQI